MQTKESTYGKTLTRRELAQLLYPELGSSGEAYRFVSVFFDTMAEQLIKDRELKIHGFGKFRCLDKKARVGRNPKTGKEVIISARRVVSFVAGGRFKRMMIHGEDGGA